MFPSIISVHPHVRGENRGQSLSAFCSDGSSPRAWGEYPRFSSDPPYLRFIPTCVGRICMFEGFLFHLSVHPHVRGENVAVFIFFAQHAGSSPRAWGEWQGVGQQITRARFIPTCVGRIQSFFPIPPLPPVHPHVRGENHPHIKISIRIFGSSPRAWGELV